MSVEFLTTIDGKKICRGCLKAKDPSDFFKTNDNSSGLRARCKECVGNENAAWREANPETHRAIVKRCNHRANLKGRFGLTVEQFEALWARCDGLCGVCHRPESRDRRLSLDHDHATGELRGFVCSRCNLLLGNAADDPELLEQAAIYLRNPPLREQT